MSLSLKWDYRSGIRKGLTPLSLHNDLLCLFPQHTLKFSDIGWSTAVVIRTRTRTSCSSKPTGSEQFRCKTRTQLHTASHTVPSDSDAKHPLQCLPSTECLSPGTDGSPRDLQRLLPQPYSSWVCFSPTQDTFKWMKNGHLAQLTFFLRKLDLGHRDMIIHLWGA